MGTVKPAHARDLDDYTFLAAVRAVTDGQGYGTAVRDYVARVLTGRSWDDPISWEQLEAEMPGKVVLAKAKRLEGRGLIDGCMCGCRGDWELTEAGMAALSSHNPAL